MQNPWLIGVLALIPCLPPDSPCRGAVPDDPFVAIESNVKGISTYVRKEEIEALTDVSGSHCVLIISPGTSFAPRDDVRAFEKCASILEKLQVGNFIPLPSDLGMTHVSPQRIVTMAWTSNSRCRMSLKSGKFVYTKLSCNDVHKMLLHQ